MVVDPCEGFDTAVEVVEIVAVELVERCFGMGMRSGSKVDVVVIGDDGEGVEEDPVDMTVVEVVGEDVEMDPGIVVEVVEEVVVVDLVIVVEFVE